MKRSLDQSHSVLALIAPYLNIFELHRIMCAREKAREKLRDQSLEVIDFLIMGLIRRLVGSGDSIYAKMSLTDSHGNAFSFSPFVKALSQECASGGDQVKDYLLDETLTESASVAEFRNKLAIFFELKEGYCALDDLSSLLGSYCGESFYLLFAEAEGQRAGLITKENIEEWSINASRNPPWAFLAEMYKTWRRYEEMGERPATPYPSALAHICFDVAAQLADQGVLGMNSLNYLNYPFGMPIIDWDEENIVRHGQDKLFQMMTVPQQRLPPFENHNDRGIFEVGGRYFFLLQTFQAHAVNLHMNGEEEPLLTLTINREGWRGLSGQVVSTILANSPAEAKT